MEQPPGAVWPAYGKPLGGSGGRPSSHDEVLMADELQILVLCPVLYHGDVATFPKSVALQVVFPSPRIRVEDATLGFIKGNLQDAQQ